MPTVQVAGIAGSTKGKINYLPASKMGDTTLEAIGPPNTIVMGKTTVVIGG